MSKVLQGNVRCLASGMNSMCRGELNRKVCGWIVRGRISVVGNSYTGFETYGTASRKGAKNAKIFN